MTNSSGTRLLAADVVRSFDGPAGAYVHIPFCEWICPFCPYNKVRADEALAERYFAALVREVDAYVAAQASTWGRAFSSLYVGGGTPTLYPEELARVVGRIPVSGERAIEVLPNHATPHRLDLLAGMGFTAVSIGAQSFHDEALRRLRRPHDAATSRGAVEDALGRFACVDVDLIVDVEWEDQGGLSGAFLADVQACFDLRVDQVSTYPLMRFGYTPFGAARHDRRREHAVLGEVSALARRMGYERRSVWTFNRRGSAPYTSITRRRFLGMGAGSSSFAGRDFYVNHFGVATYADAVEHDRLPVARWLHLGRWAGAAYDSFWQAYAGGIDLRALSAAYGPAVARAVHAGLAPLELVGLLEGAHEGFRLTPHGFDAYHDLERAVTYQLIEPLWAEMLTEHATERAERSGRPEGAVTTGARWAATDRARRGRAWSAARRAFERPLAATGSR
jgi:oxygen-independent coproporphyrinogen-3 oxidase